MKRIADSKRSGAGADDVYTLKSGTFQALQFLQKTEKPVNVVCTFLFTTININFF